MPELAVSLTLFTDYAVPYRYDDLPSGFQVDAAELRRTVDDLRAHVEGRLGALLAAREQTPFKNAGADSDTP